MESFHFTSPDPCSAAVSEYAPNDSELERNRLDIEFNTEDVILSRW